MMNDEFGDRSADGQQVDVPLIGTDLGVARTRLRAGQLVGIPTETVYGLAANALDTDAVLRIFRAKNRPAFDPLIVHTDSLERLAGFVADMPRAARLLAKAIWPGPLTLLLPKQAVIPDLVTSGLPTVAVRVPDHPLTLALLRSLPFPLAAPSANPFGYISPTTARHVTDQLGPAVAYVLDGGPARIGLESTIVGFADDTVTVFRLGGLSVESLEKIIGRPVQVQTHSTDNPAAPGMLSSHYAPRKPLTLLTNSESTVTWNIPNGQNQSGSAPDSVSDIGVLAFQTPLPGIPAHRQRVLSPTGDLAEAAKNLFGMLRELDALPIGRIYAQPVPDIGLGRAINDRLRRASVVMGDER
jgi:L-threonylcarbamoyladenylate synthase